MYEVREASRVVLVTQEIGEVVRHMEVEGFRFVMDVMGAKAFDHADGRTALVRVVIPT